MFPKSINGDSRALSRRLFLLGTGTMALSVACSQNIVNPETTSISGLRYLKVVLLMVLLAHQQSLKERPSERLFCFMGLREFR